MELLKVDSLDEAREKLLHYASAVEPKTNTVYFEDSLGMVLAQDLVCANNVPGFLRSTVDGYALIAANTAAASDSVPAFLNLIGSVEMGQETQMEIRNGQCVQIPTGGMLPRGANAVVMLEYTEEFANGIAVNKAAAAGENTVLPGEDIKKGELLFHRGTKVTPRHIGAMAGAGITHVQVFAPLSLAIVSTGDEIKPPSQPLLPAEVHDINSSALAALARQHGFAVKLTVLCKDDEALLKKTVSDAMAICDVLVVSGGSSQGEKDVTARVFAALSQPGVFTHGLALKPGKPTILAYDNASSTVLCGLPGHPVSAMVVFELLLAWFYREKCGAAPPPAVPAALTVNVPSSAGKLSCCPVRLESSGGTLSAVPVFGKSGLITTLCNADGYFLIDRNNEGVSAGETVQVHLFN